MKNKFNCYLCSFCPKNCPHVYIICKLALKKATTNTNFLNTEEIIKKAISVKEYTPCEKPISCVLDE